MSGMSFTTGYLFNPAAEYSGRTTVLWMCEQPLCNLVKATLVTLPWLRSMVVDCHRRSLLSCWVGCEGLAWPRLLLENRDAPNGREAEKSAALSDNKGCRGL